MRPGACLRGYTERLGYDCRTLRDGGLVDDFLILDGPRVVSIQNAPSPAATASLNIGRLIGERVLAKLG